jgi:hypothetical protein
MFLRVWIVIGQEEKAFERRPVIAANIGVLDL